MLLQQVQQLLCWHVSQNSLLQENMLLMLLGRFANYSICQRTMTPGMAKGQMPRSLRRLLSIIGNNPLLPLRMCPKQHS